MYIVVLFISKHRVALQVNGLRPNNGGKDEEEFTNTDKMGRRLSPCILTKPVLPEIVECQSNTGKEIKTLL